MIINILITNAFYISLGFYGFHYILIHIIIERDLNLNFKY